MLPSSGDTETIAAVMAELHERAVIRVWNGMKINSKQDDRFFVVVLLRAAVRLYELGT